YLELKDIMTLRQDNKTDETDSRLNQNNMSISNHWLNEKHVQTHRPNKSPLMTKHRKDNGSGEIKEKDDEKKRKTLTKTATTTTTTIVTSTSTSTTMTTMTKKRKNVESQSVEDKTLHNENVLLKHDSQIDIDDATNNDRSNSNHHLNGGNDESEGDQQKTLASPLAGLKEQDHEGGEDAEAGEAEREDEEEGEEEELNVESYLSVLLQDNTCAHPITDPPHSMDIKTCKAKQSTHLTELFPTMLVIEDNVCRFRHLLDCLFTDQLKALHTNNKQPMEYLKSRNDKAFHYLIAMEYNAKQSKQHLKSVDAITEIEHYIRAFELFRGEEEEEASCGDYIHLFYAAFFVGNFFLFFLFFIFIYLFFFFFDWLVDWLVGCGYTPHTSQKHYRTSNLQKAHEFCSIALRYLRTVHQIVGIHNSCEMQTLVKHNELLNQYDVGIMWDKCVDAFLFAGCIFQANHQYKQAQDMFLSALALSEIYEKNNPGENIAGTYLTSNDESSDLTECIEWCDRLITVIEKMPLAKGMTEKDRTTKLLNTKSFYACVLLQCNSNLHKNKFFFFYALKKKKGKRICTEVLNMTENKDPALMWRFCIYFGIQCAKQKKLCVFFFFAPLPFFLIRLVSQNIKKKKASFLYL
ncbi:hypothetical protein RFI_15741, partial [Reticulomyxa filosa]